MSSLFSYTQPWPLALCLDPSEMLSMVVLLNHSRGCIGRKVVTGVLKVHESAMSIWNMEDHIIILHTLLALEGAAFSNAYIASLKYERHC